MVDARRAHTSRAHTSRAHTSHGSTSRAHTSRAQATWRRIAAAGVLTLAGLTAFTALPAQAAGVRVVDSAIEEDLPPGWQVEPSPGGGYDVTWTSRDGLPVVSARPEILLDGEPLGPVETTETAVSLVAPVADRPDPADLDVAMGPLLLDERSRTTPPQSAPGEVGPGPELEADPGRRGPHAVVESDYTEDPLPYDEYPAPLDVRGHVVEPAPGEVSGPRPLVVLLHGRHEPCYKPGSGGPGQPRLFGRSSGESSERLARVPDWPCRAGQEPVPSHLGYLYLQRMLASQGYVTVSIDADAINAQDHRSLDGGADARGRLLLRHLDLWDQWAADGTEPVDMNNVVLVGHSRGGEGVHRAAQLVEPSAPYRISGVVHIAPTNFAEQTLSYVPTTVLLPSCDGDVSDLQGQIYTDLARDAVADDTALHSSVLVMGANHNFYNTEWTPGISTAPSSDDAYGKTCQAGAPGRLNAGDQRRSARTYVAAAVGQHTGTHPEYAELLDGTHGHAAFSGPHPVRVHAVGGGRDLRRVGRDAAASPPVGATSRVCVDDWFSERSCGRGLPSPHWLSSWRGLARQPELAIGWDARGQRAGLDLEEPLDLTGQESLDLRTIIDPRLGRPRLRIRVTDADGAARTVTPVSGAGMDPLSGSQPVSPAGGFAQTVRVEVDDLTGIDLARVTRVEVVGRDQAARGAWLLDLAGSPDSPPAVPARRATTLDLGGPLRVDEGDTDHMAQIPYTVQGPLASPAVIAVRLSDPMGESGPSRVRRVTIPAGATSGSIDVPVAGNEIDDLPVRRLFLDARAVRGIMVRDNVGELRIRDDDPSPQVEVTAVKPTTSEGGRAVLEVRLSEPVGYWAPFTATSIKPPRGRALEAGDLTEEFLRDHGGDDVPRGRPFHGRWTREWGALEQGRTVARVRYPIRRDRLRERPETLLLHVRSPRLDIDTTVRFRIRDRQR